MPRTAPLRPGDPLRLGEYRMLGRLGAGGQGVVYLAESPGAERLVAIKMLRVAADDEAVARFRREARVLPEVAAFCTAQVLQTGVAGTVPYLVSEYIEGPTLQQAVAERGPLRGRELSRLAVGTITALAAIHRSGVVHRDFKPANVLLSRDGPRVIDFGIARAVDGEATGGGPIGTPAYMAPEQFGETPVGPAADLFAWACTIVFAATGRSPFAADSIPAILHRILHAEPDLGALDGDLREVAQACLAKDAADRPPARQVLLRLLGRPVPVHPEAVGQEELEAGSTFAEPGTASPARRRRGRALIALGAASAGLLLAAVLGLQVIQRSGTSTAAAPQARATVGTPAAPTKTIAVPELGATLYEHPTDPLRLTAFVQTGPDLASTIGWRPPGRDDFRLINQRLLHQVAPDGANMAAVYEYARYAQDHVNEVRFTDRSGGGEFWVPTVELPLSVRDLSWADDGRRVLLTLFDPRDEQANSLGFVIVDRVTRTATVTRVNERDTGKQSYAWAPGGTAVARAAGENTDEVRIYDLRGTLQRTIKGVRVPADGNLTFSSQGQLAALCPGEKRAACVVDATTGERQATFPLPGESVIWFWYNADHLAVYDETATPPSLVAMNLDGKVVRKLAEFTGTEWTVHFSPG